MVESWLFLGGVCSQGPNGLWSSSQSSRDPVAVWPQSVVHSGEAVGVLGEQQTLLLDGPELRPLLPLSTG